jgi:uncharacterized membrane protein
MTLSSYEVTHGKRQQNGQAVRPLTQALGWFSIGLGLAECTAPRAMARLVGVADDRDNLAVLQTAGLRELASGIGILTTQQPKALLWGRFAGDVMDLLLLAGASKSAENDRTRLSAAAAAVLGVTALDLAGALALDGGSSQAQLHGLMERALPSSVSHGVHVKTAVTINRPRAEVYAFWRQLDNLPRFMSHLERVDVIDNIRSHWKAKAPLGLTVEWDANVVSDVPHEQISWKSADDAKVPNAGSVRFRDAEGGRGTEVLVELAYHPPGAGLGSAFAKLFGEEPSQQVRGDLRRFKQVMETGEVVHSDASVHRGMHPGRPALRAEVRT